MPEVVSDRVEAQTSGHGSLVLVDDRLEDLQITLEAGDPHQP